MTFDEIIDTIRRSGMQEKDKKPVILALLGLKDEYASPVQMTKDGYEVFMSYKEKYDNLSDDVAMDDPSVIAFVLNDMNHVNDNITEEELTRAWFHPKLIEVEE